MLIAGAGLVATRGANTVGPSTVGPSTGDAAGPNGLPQLGFTVRMSMPRSRYEDTFRNLRTVGAQWARVGVDRRDPGRADLVARAAAANGINLLITETLPEDQLHGRAPVDVAGYAARVDDTARRLRGRGPGGANPVFEVLNEANGSVPAATYTRLTCAADEALRAVDPSIRLIAGSAQMYISTPHWDTWLQQLLDDGMGKCIDALDAHDYQDIGWETPARSALSAMHTMLIRHGEGHKPIWLTEFGASTCPGPIRPGGCYTEQAQAAKIVNTVRELRAHYPYVPVAMVYTDRDIIDASVNDSFEQSFGIWHTDGQNVAARPKLAVEALRKLYAGS